MNDPTKFPSVFDYLDYRRYLEDYFAARKLADYRFSLRGFAQLAGLPLSNSSLFSKVIAGKRNLTQDLRFKLAKALKLELREMRYFDSLVQFNQAKNEPGKRHLYAELATHRKSKARIISKEGFEYYSKWQNAIVRAYFGIQQKENNPDSIGRRVFPQLSPREVEEAINLLLQLDLITKTANGFAIKDPHIAAARENQDFVGKLRVVEMLKLAQDVFANVPASDRDYNTMTMYISKQGYQGIQDRIRTFREELKSLIDADQGEDRIYTLNMQLFPNSIPPEWNGRSPRKGA